MPPNRILFLSNAEHGALNPMLAVCHEVLRLDRNTEVHLASFPSAESSARNAFKFTLQCFPSAVPPVFHTLPSLSLTETLLDKDPDLWTVMGTRLTPWTMRSTHQRMTSFLMPWDASDFIAIYGAIEKLVQSLSPSLLVVDIIMPPGLSICKTLELKHVVFTPNTLKDLLSMFQPRAQGLWRYPSPAAGFAFPVPWHQIPLNVLYALALVFTSIFNGRTSRIVKGIRASAPAIQILTVGELAYQRPPGLKILVSSSEESDLPLENIPDDLVACGPVARAVPKLVDVDAELAQWLGRGPTVFINMGTLARCSKDEAIEIASSVRVLLDRNASGAARENLQVLWKLQKAGNYSTGKGSLIYDILGREVEADTVRITPWVKAEPGSILATGHVVCSVHHGGANTYNEALINGVPQVVLPVWADTYDFANRVEWLGIGRWGSPQSRPKCKSAEFGPILVDAVLGPRAQEIMKKARKLAQVCNKDGGGAAVAAKEIFKSLE